MVSYRDMTFCKHYEDCGLGHVCSRALTPEVKEAARKWWAQWAKVNEAVPISVFTDKPFCWKEDTDDE